MESCCSSSYGAVFCWCLATVWLQNPFTLQNSFANLSRLSFSAQKYCKQSAQISQRRLPAWKISQSFSLPNIALLIKRPNAYSASGIEWIFTTVTQTHARLTQFEELSALATISSELRGVFSRKTRVPSTNKSVINLLHTTRLWLHDHSSCTNRFITTFFW